MKLKFKRILKTIGLIFAILLTGLILTFYWFVKPVSDTAILKKFKKSSANPTLIHQKINTHDIRIITNRKTIDDKLPSIIFIHGTPGSSLDFKKYFLDADLNKKANLIVYDRVGYGISNTGKILNSIADEVAVLEKITEKLSLKEIILIGYSYGGPIALASNKNYKKIILLAPAVSSDAEYIPCAINLYKWKFTRWLIPAIFKAASIEKLHHQDDLKNFENSWNKNQNNIISIHGDKDGIVPYKNTQFLQNNLDRDKFKIVTLENAGHGLVWTHFEEIKKEIIQVLED